MARTIPLPVRKRGPNGEPLCRWCGKPVPKGRREWCGPACVEQYSLRANPQHWARRIMERDQYRCLDCGRDVAAIDDELDRMERESRVDCDILSCYPGLKPHIVRERGVRYRVLAYGSRTICAVWHLRKSLGLGPRASCGAAHHVVAVRDGGKSTLENGVTLCVWCHKGRHAGQKVKNQREGGK